MKHFFIPVIASLMLSTIAQQPLFEAAPYPANDWRVQTSAYYTSVMSKQGTLDVVFLGDFITHEWNMPWVKDNGTNVWNTELKEFNKFNLGMSGDNIGNILWRITEGKQLDGFTTKVIVLSAGAEDLQKRENKEVAEGIKQLISVIQEKQPNAKILLMGILPIAWLPERNTEVNGLISGYADDLTVFYLDPAPLFKDSDGKLVNLKNGVHPTEAGFRSIAKILVPELQNLLKN